MALGTAQHKTADCTGWSEGRTAVSWDQSQCSNRRGDQTESGSTGTGWEENDSFKQAGCEEITVLVLGVRTIEKTESSPSIKCPLNCDQFLHFKCLYFLVREVYSFKDKKTSAPIIHTAFFLLKIATYKNEQNLFPHDTRNRSEFCTSILISVRIKAEVGINSKETELKGTILSCQSWTTSNLLNMWCAFPHTHGPLSRMLALHSFWPDLSYLAFKIQLQGHFLLRVFSNLPTCFAAVLFSEHNAFFYLSTSHTEVQLFLNYQ